MRKGLPIALAIFAGLAAIGRIWAAPLPPPQFEPEMLGCGDQRVLALQDPPMTGEDIEELQSYLALLGYELGSVDGVFGPKTAEAVARFKSDHGLDGDGRMDALSWSVLGRALTPAAEAAAAQDAPTGELHILVDAHKLRLTLFADGEPYKTYPVAVGRPTRFTRTPVGEWRIVHKALNWGGGFGTRWMGLNVPWGIYGIHGTNKPGSIGARASGGCIRMHNRDVEELYRWVPVGTRVIIIGDELPESYRSRMQRGATGRDVVQVQLRLGSLGFDPQGADGRFGPDTQRAVESLQEVFGLPVDGVVQDDVYVVLGLP